MRSFREASDYITNKSTYEVFERVAIYVVWAEFKYEKGFGHDFIATFLSCFTGPFDGFNNDPYKDPAIKDILEFTNWGWNKSWPEDLIRWGRKYCRTNDDIASFNSIMKILREGKADDVYTYLIRNAQDPPPLQLYFPELATFGFANNRNWPRK